MALYGHDLTMVFEIEFTAGQACVLKSTHTTAEFYIVSRGTILS
jgi:hypothetical protein